MNLEIIIMLFLFKLIGKYLQVSVVHHHLMVKDRHFDVFHCLATESPDVLKKQTSETEISLIKSYSTIY
jgi:hypothetical protein